MSDLIDRQAALDALIFDVRAGRQNGKTLMVRYAEEVIKRIKELPSAQPGWIPCKTALPEHDGEYLVTKKSFGWNCNEYTETDIARYEKKDGWHKADTVLAWCELPKPWEGGQE